MYKAMHQSMRDSDKLANLSDFAFRVWEMGCVASDLTGRITANPKRFWARAMPMVPFDEAKYLAAFKELKGLVHFYDVDGKPYMVFHDHEEHNKGAKNLRNIRPDCPPPPPNLCYCVTYSKEEEGGASADGTADATADGTAGVPFRSSPVHVLGLEGVQGEPFSPTSPEAMIMGLLERAHCPTKPETQRRYAKAWITNKGFQYVEQACSDPFCKGKDVLAINDRFFRDPKPGKGSSGPKRKVHDPACQKCAGTGRRLNPVTNAEMDCSTCVREVAV